MNKITAILILAIIALCATMSAAQAAQRVTYFHTDNVGSPFAATDESGTVIWREDYRPFGERLRKEVASAGNETWYAGKRHDEYVNLTYSQARWYDPEVGRFMGIDPVAFQEASVLSFNQYVYANNNPYKYVDEDGQASKIASLIRLTSTGVKKVARLTKEQAIRARKAGQNVHADTHSYATQIEIAAHGTKDLLKHKGHKLPDGSIGMPHVQTDGVPGHTFWGTLTSALLGISVVLEQVANVAEVADPFTYISSSNVYLDENGKPLSEEDLKKIYNGTYNESTKKGSKSPPEKQDN